MKKFFERKESIRYVVFSGRKLSKKWSVHNAFLEKSLAKDLNDISCQFLATRTFEQGSPLMREFSVSWHLVLVFQNKRDLKFC